MKSHLISRLVSLCAVMTGLHAANLAHADEKATKPASMTQTVQDQYQAKRDLLIRAYKSLNSNLEGGMFPSIYWDRKQIDAPGGVRLDSTQTLNAVKVTPISKKDKIPVVSYNPAVQKAMLEMAEGRVPSMYANTFKVELVTLNLGTLNKDNLPHLGDQTFTNAVYYLPAAQRDVFHQQALEAHLRIAEKTFGANRFYQYSLPRQAAILDMVYPLKDKFKDTKFAKAVLAGDWKTAKAEAYASSLEKGKRRHLARQILLDCDNGSPNTVPEFSVVLSKLPAGESALARLICNGILKEHQEILKTRQENTGKGNQAKTQPSSKSAKNIHAAQKTKGAER